MNTSKQSSLKRVFLILILSLVSSILFNFCKKEKEKGGGKTLSSYLKQSARLSESFNDVGYDPILNVLEFTSVEHFKSTLSSLALEIENFQFDNGYSAELLAAMNSGLNEEELCDSLINNSPLSDTVLVTFMSKTVSDENFRNVIEANLDLSVNAAIAFMDKVLPAALKNELLNEIKNRTQYAGPLTEFENLFSGYTSHRKSMSDAEISFLASGADPESESNPMNSSLLEDPLESTLWNNYLEVKIGGRIIKLLEDRNIMIKDASSDIVNDIRQNNNVPIYTLQTEEPANGFLAVDAPMPIDTTNIIVEPTNHVNGPCNDYIVASPPGMAARGTESFDADAVQFSTSGAAAGLTYYWDFGDGYVSYLESPIHVYMGSAEIYTVTVTTFNSQGSPCGSFSGGIGSGKPGGGSPNPCAVTGALTANRGQGNQWFSTIDLNISLPGYQSGQNITFALNRGDGSAVVNGNFTSAGHHQFTHNYPQNTFQTYNLSISLSWFNHDISQTCNWTMPANITFVTPQQEPQQCCEKRDKEKYQWKGDNNNIKYKHKVKLKNNVGLGGKLKTHIKKYHKFIGIWVATNAYSEITLSGWVYYPCYGPSNYHIACDDEQHRSEPISADNSGTFFFQSAYYNGGSCAYFVKKDEVLSSAYCWGYESKLFLVDCDD